MWRNITILLALTAGCVSLERGPRLGPLYDRAASHHGPDRNPVIVIPGILGSKLVQEGSGRIVWGAFAGGYADPRTSDGARLTALPMREGDTLMSLTDEAAPAGVLDRVRVSLLGVPLELAAYVRILSTLGVGGYRDELLGTSGAVDYGDEHFTCFQFDYDWRRDNVENARRLHDFIVQKRRYVQEEIERRFGVQDAEVKFDIVAHSMGGLVTRYYLRYGEADLPADGSTPEPTWAGAKYVERAILVGTPSAGSVKALVQLVEGASFAPILPTYPPAILGTMPSIYQLMPRVRHRAVLDLNDPQGEPIDIYDPQVWQRMGWGLAAADQDRVLRKLLPDAPDAHARRRVALDHLAKCLARARQFQDALDRPAPLPDGLKMYLFSGDAVMTPATASVDSRTGRVRIAGWGPGDGTVLRSSALMDERVGSAWRPELISPIAWTGVTFLFTDHLGMTKDAFFYDNVLYLLLEKPR